MCCGEKGRKCTVRALDGDANKQRCYSRWKEFGIFSTLKWKFIWSESSKSWYIKSLHLTQEDYILLTSAPECISFLQAWFSFVFWINSNGYEPVLTLWPTTLALFTVMCTWEQSGDLPPYPPWRIQTTCSHEEVRWHVVELGLGSVRTSELDPSYTVALCQGRVS